MARRFNIITIFLLFLIIGLVLSTKNNTGNARPTKRKDSPPQLSDNIAENPFLKERIASTRPVVYAGNPFLSATPQLPLHLHGNGSEQQNTHISTNPFSIEENDEVTVGTYIHNPFLQPSTNTANGSASSVPPNAPRINITIVDAPVTSLPITLERDQNTRTKSDRKCEEYARQVSGTTEVLSLVGTNTEVTKVNNGQCSGEINSLVIGGTTATSGEFPHMVALGTIIAGTFMFHCGGSLISPEWVLTAAHCTYGPNGSPTIARIGFHNLRHDPYGITAPINRIVRHPNYKPPAMYADIALLNLKTAVTFSRLLRPACLYQLYDTVPTQAWVSGWGVTEFGGEESDLLQKALLEIVDNIACTIRHNRSIAVPHGVTPSMICAGDPRGGWVKDTCQGDSGGPLQVIHPKNLCLFQVIGITSFGEACAIVDTPGVYTRVSHYLSWIEDIVWPDA